MKYFILALLALTGCATGEPRPYSCQVTKDGPFGERVTSWTTNATSSGKAEDLMRTFNPNAKYVDCREY